MNVEYSFYDELKAVHREFVTRNAANPDARIIQRHKELQALFNELEELVYSWMLNNKPDDSYTRFRQWCEIHAPHIVVEYAEYDLLKLYGFGTMYTWGKHTEWIYYRTSGGNLRTENGDYIAMGRQPQWDYLAYLNSRSKQKEGDINNE